MNVIKSKINQYKDNLNFLIDHIDANDIEITIKLLREVRDACRNIYIIGNGGSGGNANHIANDFTYGVGVKNNKYIDIESLCANSSVITCLANDIGYENIFAHQLSVKGSADDLLISLSGSGNSKNIINAIQISNKLGLNTLSVVGFDGGRALGLSKYAVHIPIYDMQLAEDFQLVFFHICAQILCNDD